MELFLSCVKAFVIGGILCAIGQILIDYTKLTPARILVSYVVAGVILGAVGLYAPLAYCGCDCYRFGNQSAGQILISCDSAYSIEREQKGESHRLYCAMAFAFL